ncbi:MAG: toll/interleukin-1 receptor domain-containing protein [Chthoniobacterales bacterium]
MAHDVFISHADKDKRVAEAICEKLESAQLRCWIAPRDILPDEDWTEAVRNAIGSSRVMLLVFSENANAAPHIEREIAHAFYTGRTIVPLRLTNTPPRRNFLFYLGEVRWLDAFSPRPEQQLEALTARIMDLMPGPTVTCTEMLAPAATKTVARLDFSNSRRDALLTYTSNRQTPKVLKRVAIAASAFAALCLLWFALPQTKHGVSPAGNNLEGTSSGPGTSPDSPSQQNKGDTSVPKPEYTLGRLGLWVRVNPSPTPLVRQGPQDPPSFAPGNQSASVTPPPPSDLGQRPGGESERLAARANASVKSVDEGRTRIVNRREGHREKLRPRSHNKRSSAPEGSRFAGIKNWLTALWHQSLAPSKATSQRSRD